MRARTSRGVSFSRGHVEATNLVRNRAGMVQLSSASFPGLASLFLVPSAIDTRARCSTRSLARGCETTSSSSTSSFVREWRINWGSSLHRIVVVLDSPIRRYRATRGRRSADLRGSERCDRNGRQISAVSRPWPSRSCETVTTMGYCQLRDWKKGPYPMRERGI